MCMNMSDFWTAGWRVMRHLWCLSVPESVPVAVHWQFSFQYKYKTVPWYWYQNQYVPVCTSTSMYQYVPWYWYQYQYVQEWFLGQLVGGLYGSFHVCQFQNQCNLASSTSFSIRKYQWFFWQLARGLCGTFHVYAFPFAPPPPHIMETTKRAPRSRKMHKTLQNLHKNTAPVVFSSNIYVEKCANGIEHKRGI